jgi:hypothetical protein
VKESDSRHGAESSRAAVGKGSVRTIPGCDLVRSSTGSWNVRRLGLVSPRGQLAGSGWAGSPAPGATPALHMPPAGGRREAAGAPVSRPRRARHKDGQADLRKSRSRCEGRCQRTGLPSQGSQLSLRWLLLAWREGIRAASVTSATLETARGSVANGRVGVAAGGQSKRPQPSVGMARGF